MEKKIPMRKCLGCDEMNGKEGLIRIVRSKDGEISADPTGKRSGRGAYICRDIKCLEKARKKKAFERAFGCAVPEEVYAAVAKQLTEAGEAQ